MPAKSKSTVKTRGRTAKKATVRDLVPRKPKVKGGSIGLNYSKIDISYKP